MNNCINYQAQLVFPRISSIIVATMNFACHLFASISLRTLGNTVCSNATQVDSAPWRKLRRAMHMVFLGKKTHHGDTGFATCPAFVGWLFSTSPKNTGCRITWFGFMDCHISYTLLFFCFLTIRFVQTLFLKLIWLALPSPSVSAMWIPINSQS